MTQLFSAGDREEEVVRKKTKRGKGSGGDVCVQINNGANRAKEQKGSNKISTTRFKLWNFLPMAVFEQFRRLANFYFVINAIIACIPGVTPIDPGSAIVPLVLVIMMSVTKEGIEDLLRARADRKANSKRFSVIRKGKLVDTPSSNLKSGEIVKIANGSVFPADAIVLSSSFRDNSCFVETSNLDGESNLKKKSAPRKLSKWINEHLQNEHLQRLNEDPAIPSFSPHITVREMEETEMEEKAFPNVFIDEEPEEIEAEEELEPVDVSVCSTGDTTGASEAPEMAVRNPDSHSVLLSLVAEFDCEAPCADMNTFVGRLSFSEEDGLSFNDLPSRKKRVVEGISSCPLSVEQLLLRGTQLRNTDFVYAAIVYTGKRTRLMQNQRAPVSKFSRVERILNRCVKIIFIFNFICIAGLAIAAGFHSSSLRHNHLYMHSSTGSVSSAFQGVLTHFVLLSYMIPISLYVSVETTRVCQSRFMIWDKLCRTKEGIKLNVLSSNVHEELGQVKVVFSDKTGTLTRNVLKLKRLVAGMTLFDRLSDVASVVRHPGDDSWEDVDHILRMITLCHSVLPEKHSPSLIPKSSRRRRAISALSARFRSSSSDLSSQSHDQGNDGDIEDVVYQAESPDEGALVSGARICGYTFVDAYDDLMAVKVRDEMDVFHLLAKIEFTSERRCMSVVVRDPRGQISIFTKGADSALRQMLAEPEGCNAAEMSERIDFVERATHSFSVCGLRCLWFASRPVPEDEWEKFGPVYENALGTLGPGRVRAVARVAETIEHSLFLRGCTAVEDQLQDRVPETVQYLMHGGVQMWMLTGDKTETGISVAFAAKFLNSEMMILSLTHPRSVMETIVRCSHLKAQCETAKREMGLLVDGDSLRNVFSSPQARENFLYISRRCVSVVCCRTSPLQKALVVRLVKQGTHYKWVTLAIGDGANDVSMIREAHVGVGIDGLEGTQAARAADYSIGQFHFLRRLVAVHGRYAYVRLTGLVQFVLYKNMTFALPQLYYAFFCGFSGQTLYESWVMTFFNTIYTFAPSLCYSIFEKDVPESVLQACPSLNKQYQKGGLLSTWLFSNGKPSSVPGLGLLICSAVIVTVNLKILLYSHFITWVSMLVTLLCTLGYFFIVLLIGIFPRSKTFLYVPEVVFAAPSFWIALLLIVVICLLPDVILKYVRIRTKCTEAEARVFRYKSPRKRRSVRGVLSPCWRECSSHGDYEADGDNGIVSSELSEASEPSDSGSDLGKEFPSDVEMSSAGLADEQGSSERSNT